MKRNIGQFKLILMIFEQYNMKYQKVLTQLHLGGLILGHLDSIQTDIFQGLSSKMQAAIFRKDLDSQKYQVTLKDRQHVDYEPNLMNPTVKKQRFIIKFVA